LLSAAVSDSLSTFLIEAANFLILAAVLSWVFFRPIRNALARRQAAMRQQTDEIAARLADAERKKTDFDRRLASLEQELDQRRSEAETAAEQETAQIIAAARETARRETQTARKRLAGLEQGQLERLSRVVAESAGAAVDRLLRSLEQPALAQALVDAACRQIREFDGNSLAPVRVESAEPLDKPARDSLLAALGPAGESAQFLVVEDLGAGLRVATARGLIDVSAAGLAGFAERTLAERLSHENSNGTREAAGD
jgi:F-type H+-transporting ATPase subunit b